MKIYLLIPGLVMLCSMGIAQTGSSCADPIPLDTLENQCSSNGEYNLGAQGNSGVARPSCFPEDSGVKDMWFRFKPTFKNINIVIRGASRFGNESNLRQPQMALYIGDCQNLEVVSCASDARGLNFIELTVGDLLPGATYLIRVSSRTNHDGKFQLCINNFQFTSDYSSDCPEATVLCDKETIKVDLVTGTGKVRDEADDSCLDTDPRLGSDDGNSESSSVWFKWIAKNDGMLTFTLDPINPVDDIDFAVFELPDGLNDCGDKVILRCMASGENVGEPFDTWRICTGATGLRDGEDHTSEQRGCQEGNTNFLSPLKMEAGKAYALLVNNFSESGSGFRLEWGGDGEFAGPSARLVFLDDKPVYCPNEDIRFYAEDNSISGTITAYEWVYSGAMKSGDLRGVGPHSISFPDGGTKSVILNLKSDIGCISSIDTFIEVEEPISITAVIDSISCYGDGDGSIDVDFDSPSTVTSAFWIDGPTDRLRTGLDPGAYTFMVRNERECSASATWQLGQPLPIVINQILTNASCGGGMDGSIDLGVSGTFDPFEYDFHDGQGFTGRDTRDNLQAGVYPVSVRDEMGCTADTLVLLSEINLNIDASVIREPRCFGLSDGSVELNVSGGRPPYLYDFDTTGNYRSENRISGLSAGFYVVAIRDRDQCTAFKALEVGQPDSIVLSLDTIHISCFGERDGQITITVTGGTPAYRYDWDHGPFTRDINNLPTGNYHIEILDEHNCPAEAFITLREPPELTLRLDRKMDLLCFGDSDGYIEVTAAGGTGNFVYSINNGSLSPQPEFDQLTAGRYTVYVRDEILCRDSIDVELIQPEEVVVHITAPGDSTQTIRLGQSLELGSAFTPTDRNMSWVWSPAEKVDCEDCPRVHTMPVVNTRFILTGTDQDGCVGTDELLVRVIPIRDIGVPNVVVPGQSDQDSYVTVYGGPHIGQILRFDVFDRWGNLLFTRSNFPPNQYELGWDGTAQGKRLIPGIYVYSVQVEFIDKFIGEYAGEILILE